MLSLSLIIPYRSVQAATLTVSTCDSAELIAAIAAANVTPEDDLIELNGGCSYTLTAIDNSTSGNRNRRSSQDRSTKLGYFSH